MFDVDKRAIANHIFCSISPSYKHCKNKKKYVMHCVFNCVLILSLFYARRLSAEQLIRSKRVPTTASVVISSHTSNDVSFDSNIRTELLYLHSKPSQSTTPEPPQVLQNSNFKEVKLNESKDEESQEKTKSIAGKC